MISFRTNQEFQIQEEDTDLNNQEQKDYQEENEDEIIFYPKNYTG